MASIHGISLKSVKKFSGHEGEPCYQGNLYLRNKKIGFWSQDSHGGPDYMYLEAGYSERKLDEAVVERSILKSQECSKLYGFPIKYDLDHLCWELIELRDDEAEFKKHMKAGNGCLVVLHTAMETYYWSTKSDWGSCTNKEILDKFEPEFKKILDDMDPWMKDLKYLRKCVYRTPNDFIFGDPIPFDEITKEVQPA